MNKIPMFDTRIIEIKYTDHYNKHQLKIIEQTLLTELNIVRQRIIELRRRKNAKESNSTNL